MSHAAIGGRKPGSGLRLRRVAGAAPTFRHQTCFLKMPLIQHRKEHPDPRSVS